MSPSILFLYNPEAGKARPFSPSLLGGKRTDPPGTPLWLEAALSHLRVRLGRDFEAIACDSFEATRDMAAAAAVQGVSVVIAAGGDGTLRAAAEGIAGTETALGILPRGTVNVLARELYIPLDRIEDALDICLDGVTRRLDLGRADGRYFLLMCSVGFDALAVHSVRPEIKEVVGAPAYVLSGMAALSTFIPPQMNLRLDGNPWRPIQAFTMIIANSPAYGGDFRIAPDAEMDDGLLDICVFGAPPGPVTVQRAAFLRQVGAVTLGRAAADPDIYLLRARRIEIATVPKVATQIDGDASGTTPITVEIAPKALAVRVAS